MMKQYFLFVVFFATSLLSFSQVPANDICANAISITVNGGYIAANNSNTVTNAANPSCGGSTAIKDIWYKFVYAGGTVVIETQLGTNTDTRIAIYTACGGTQLACNDDFGGTYRSYISLTCPQLTIGNTYYIQAGGYNAVIGAFTIQVTSSGSLGCTDPMATNYNACAATNNGTCVYPILTAQFNYAPTGTNCLNVQYTSTSSGNITGYNWSFPGGTPSSSTVQNPVVTYPSGGTYSATLTVTDLATSSTITNNNVLVTTGDIVTVDITPDANPTQTSWKMFDNLGTIVAQGTSNDATFCINSTCHKFEIYDSGSNGFSGAGNYKVYLNGIQVANGAAFTSRDIRDINCPEGASCNNTIDAVLGINEVPFDNTWYVYTPAENGQYRISTCGLAACDTRIWIYDYCVMANFDNTVEATYTYNDDFCGVQAQTDVFMTGGDTYYVRVGSAGACAGSSYDVLFEYVGPITGCQDNLACNFNPLASVSGPCYYNGDPNCSGLGPDLEVDGGQLYSSLVAATMNGTDACLVNEGCLQGLGTREILKFTTRITNIGTQDYFIGVPNAGNPQFVFDGCHNHYHYAGYAEYLLYDQTGTPMPQIGFKNGFCVLDLSCPSGISAQYGCGNMGITAGCADIYSSSLSCQWIDVTGVPAGDYYLVVRTNWDQDPDANGRYELRYDNNWAQVCIHFDRNPTTGALTGFTKNNTSCPIIEDCIGVPFGDHYPDCANNCPGVVKRGDVNNDTYLNPFDEHLYGEAAVLGGVTVTPCTDLNSDGEITVADASYVADCIHQQADLGVNPLLYTECPWDPEFWDPSESVTLGITNLNTTEQYFDVYIINPMNEVYALQMDFSGAVLSSVENLLPNTTWFAHPHVEIGGNSIAATSEIHTKIPISIAPLPILRVHYSSLTGNTVCISNIIDVLNDFNHNVLTNFGDCQSVIPGITADFTASQTSVCSGQSVTFTDATTGGATAWSWSFPGGSPASSILQNPTVTYNTGGNYDVTLTATGPGGTDAEIKLSYIFVGASVQWFLDTDNDGYGSNSTTVNACVAPNGFVSQGGDCNNNNAAIYPGATEVCNGVDDDCDASVDEGFDLDGDGYTVCDGDCDDGNALAYPGAFEICNALDEDCDGQVDEGYDQDNDGFTVCAGDCNDNNSAVNPGAFEICNGIDDNCNASTDEGFDVDNDGFTSCNGDCNDNNSAIKPGATEVCNGADDNCNSSIDEGFDVDNDGFTACNGDCNDNNASINPEASEICNNIDDDCSGGIDEGFDNDNDGYTTCEGDCNDANASIKPGASEICNLFDDNCNALIDEGFDTDNDGYTSCGGDCSDSNPLINPGQAELCNGIDDNCNGLIDEGYDVDGDGYTTCQNDCADDDPDRNPGLDEICGNGFDDNCDGIAEGDNAHFNCPANLLLSCEQPLPSDALPLIDGCGNEVIAYTQEVISLEICNTVIRNSYVAYRDGIIIAQCTYDIIIVDTTAPVFINCPSDITLYANIAIGSQIVIYGVSATDNCDNSVTITCNHPSGSSLPLGNTVIQCVATDNCGNTDTCSFNVNVLPSFLWFRDFDFDGFGNAGDSMEAPEQPNGYVSNSGDCNDSDFFINPNAIEICFNTIDENCNGLFNESQDDDNDGYSACDGDCNDNNASINPGAAELCNAGDDNCNGSIDEGFDQDNDGFTSCNGDCNDNNAAVYPGSTEICNNADDDCDGTVDEGFDNDSDGFTSCSGDCNDSNSAIHPGATEVCNGMDEDCDSSIDEGFDVDSDGFTSCAGDCNDNNAFIFPGAFEACNNLDDNCNGTTDEGFDLDNDGYTSCNGDCNDNNGAVNPGATETCNSTDDNCNGQIDEGAGPLYYTDADGDGYGNPSTGLNSCVPITGRVTNGLDCFDNNSARYPGAIEMCNGIDDDCDGAIDDNCSNVVNDFYANAISLIVAPYNTCNTINGTLSGATVSPEANSVAVTGQDVWYKFVATAPGIRIRVLTNTTDAMIELQNSSGTTLDVENIQSIKGNESMNYGSLVTGNTYYIAVRNNNSALGAGVFSICLTALPNTSCNSPEGPYSLCGTFKATSTSAYQYTFNFTSLTNGSVYTRNQGSVNCVLNTVAGLPLGHTFSVRIDAVYSVSLGNGVSELITILGPSTCSMITSPDPALYLRDNQTCPAARAMNSLIRTNTTICSISNYGWEFQVANLSQPAFYVNSGTAYTTTLSAAAGFAPGTTYNVRIRATYTNGFVGTWGPVRCMVIGGVAGMAMEDESDFSDTDESRFEEANINLYPNPSKGDAFNLMIEQVKNGEVGIQIFDAMGRSIWANRYFTDGYLNTQVTFDEPLSTGLYLVEVTYDGNVVTEKILVQK